MSQQINPTADVNTTGAKTNKFQGFVDGLVTVFDKGLNVYRGVTERIQALREIDKETVNEQPAVVKVSEEQGFFDKADNRKILIIGAVGLSAVALLLVSRK